MATRNSTIPVAGTGGGVNKRRGRVAGFARWIPSATATILFASAAVEKLTGTARADFAAWGYPAWFMVAVGVVELGGAVAILFPRGAVVGTAGLTAVMIGALGTILRFGDYERIPVTVFALTLTIWAGVLHRRRSARRWPRHDLALVGMLAMLVGGLSIWTQTAIADEPSPIPEHNEHGFAGSWSLVVTFSDGSLSHHLATLAADGTLIETALPVQPAPPEAPFRLIFPSPGHGGWQDISERTATFAFVRLLTDEGGTYLGTLEAEAEVTLAVDTSRFEGRVVFNTVDAAGAPVGSGSGTVTGSRI